VEAHAVPGVIRAQRPFPAIEKALPAEIIEQAERGIIHGKVLIVADDRTNVLIIITRPENMGFFEKIIKVLDVETEPDVTVKVIRLEFAKAEKVADMLNDLIGAARSGGDDDAKAPATGTEGGKEGGESAALKEYVRRVEKKPTTEPGKTKIGQLSTEDIKILADERANSLIIMAPRADIETLQELVSGMDVMLSQVTIEAVILEVNINDEVRTGVDWVQRAMVGYSQEADGTRTPLTAFAGQGGGGTETVMDPTRLTTIDSFPSGAAGLTYYMTFFDLNVDAVINLLAMESRTRILSSPVIMTTDNEEATIDVATEQYFYKGKRYAGGTDNPVYEDDVEVKSVGIVLTVTPRINEKGFVVMEIEQKIENVSGVQTINDVDWPVVTSRKLDATVAVQTGETIVLGGLVLNSDTKSSSGVPILSKIPLLGIPFRSSRKKDESKEVVVFITPYVVDTPEEIEAEARRRRDAVDTGGLWKKGWSDSKLAEPAKVKASKDAKPEASGKKPAPAKATGKPAAAKPAAKAAPTKPAGSGHDVIDPAIRALLEAEEERFGDDLKKVDDRAAP
jgi:general secretion pathway protein D